MVSYIMTAVSTPINVAYFRPETNIFWFKGLNTALFGILTGFDHSYPSLMKLILRLSRTKMVKSTPNYIRWSRLRVSEGFETRVGL